MNIGDIFAWLAGSKVGMAAGGVLGGIAIVIGIKAAKSYLPGIVAKWLGSQIDAALKAGDPDDDELVLAICHWAEAKVGPGKGEEKAKLVAQKIAAIAPSMAKKEADIQAIIQAVFDKSREAINARTNVVNGPKPMDKPANPANG